MNNRIGIIGCYYLIEEFQSAAVALRKLGWIVDFFPFLYYKQHDDANITKDLLLFAQGKKDKLNNDKIVITTENKQADVLLWWGITDDSQEIVKLKSNYKCTNAYYFHNDPLDYFDNHKHFDKVSNEFNLIITNNSTNAEVYKKMVSEICIVSPAIDPSIHFNSQMKAYDADVSFVYDAAYDRTNENFKQYDWITLLKQLIADTHIKVNIYGPLFLKSEFGENYIKDLNYSETKFVYSNSKINLSCHSSTNHDKLVNHRCIQILASKGLLLVDQTLGSLNFFQDGVNAIFIKPNDAVEQIKELLKNNVKMVEIANEGYKLSSKYTYKLWAKTITLALRKFIKNNNSSLPSENENEVVVNVKYPQTIVDTEIVLLLNSLKLSNTPLHGYFAELSKTYEHAPFDINTILNAVIKD